jgi:hypothetical protein
MSIVYRENHVSPAVTQLLTLARKLSKEKRAARTSRKPAVAED